MVYELQSEPEIYTRVNNLEKKQARVLVLPHDTLPNYHTYYYKVLLQYYKGLRKYEVYNNNLKIFFEGKYFKDLDRATILKWDTPS